MEAVLQSNEDLAMRMNGLQREGSILSREASMRTSIANLTNHETSQTLAQFCGTEAEALNFTFEQDLIASRVYNKAVYRHSSASLTSTALYTTALSVFSKLSLSQISNLSFYALPVYAADLSNSQFYVFGEEGASRRDQVSKPTAVDAPEENTAEKNVHKVEEIKIPSEEPRPSEKSRPSDDSRPVKSRQPLRLLGRYARPQLPVISVPSNPMHVTHVDFDSKTGEYVVRTIPHA